MCDLFDVMTRGLSAIGNRAGNPPITGRGRAEAIYNQGIMPRQGLATPPTAVSDPAYLCSALLQSIEAGTSS